ncbi:MAG: serine hydrolase [Pseudomonadota bacterium]
MTTFVTLAMLFLMSGCDSELERDITAGWMARMICSAVFVSGRPFDDVVRTEFGRAALGGPRRFHPRMDEDTSSITVVAHNHAGTTVSFRSGLGCALDIGDQKVRSDRVVWPLSKTASDEVPWPIGTALDRGVEGIDLKEVDRLVEQAIAYGDHHHGLGSRAMVVVYQGKLVAEAYREGFPRDMPLYGASMTKTIVAMLVGVRVRDGAVSIEQKALREEWNKDARRAITLDHLLHMVSGLRWNESYSLDSDVDQMLFTQSDMAAFAVAKPLDHAPGTHWEYSSGTTNIISAVLRDTFESDGDWYKFPRASLFQPLGLQTAVFETDSVGNFVGSSFLWASAQDFARLGQLLANDGVWDGKRLLPEGWVDYMRTPGYRSQRNRYGAQTWLYRSDGGAAPWFSMNGFGGQHVMVHPEKKLVVVRLGWDAAMDSWDHRRFMSSVLKTIDMEGPLEP